MNGVLPADVVAVWGADPAARLLVNAWSLNGFRGSRLHQLAVVEAGRAPKPRMRPFRPDPKGGPKNG